MFIPGHLHLASASEVDRQAFDIHLRYRVLEAEARPVAVHFDMEGRIDGQPFSESFETQAMPCNFQRSGRLHT